MMPGRAALHIFDAELPDGDFLELSDEYVVPEKQHEQLRFYAVSGGEEFSLLIPRAVVAALATAALRWTQSSAAADALGLPPVEQVRAQAQAGIRRGGFTRGHARQTYRCQMNDKQPRRAARVNARRARWSGSPS